jgi:hypothetical protein
MCSGSRRKLSSLAIYTEEDSTIDMSDLTPVDEKDASDKQKNNNVSCLSFNLSLLL